jgi:hypothetical protein
MKNFLLVGTLFASMMLNAQEPASELNCYNKWAAKFEERGADKVEDGLYTDVIITNRQGAKATCYQGKAEVHDGFVTRFYILLSDGSYEEFKRRWKNNSDQNVEVINGMSTSMISVHNELVNVIWPSKIRARKGMPVVAAEPVAD